MAVSTEFIALKQLPGGDGSSLDLEGPRVTTSLRYRREPLARPEEQLRVLNEIEIEAGPTKTGDFDKDLAVSGLGASGAGATGRFPDQCGQTVQHDLPALPCRFGAGQNGGEHGPGNRGRLSPGH